MNAAKNAIKHLLINGSYLSDKMYRHQLETIANEPDLTPEEWGHCRYALLELASKRQEQSIDRKDPICASEAVKLRDIARRLDCLAEKEIPPC